MPADITGTTIITETPDGRLRFRFERGPVFASLVWLTNQPGGARAARLDRAGGRVTVAGGTICAGSCACPQN
jgi:MoxR-like ATPase